ncbi:ATP-binding protein [Paenibacillus alginolyticus]|uniref:ATP-binding protein n=1 Tax=Paenibacillus alginolyticus TaxID=59839 RepID=UPI00041B4DBE|nr:ATP-binding protein [Paenibacillus alginolyticus]MCY9666522.1 ATP-binding protein [Paenibacillus alginolyticus]
MKSVINKLFGSPGGGSAQAQPNLPSPVTTQNIHDHQMRSLIGWIANRLGQKLQMDTNQTGYLIYLSLSQDSYTQDQSDDNQYLLYLASCLVGWILQEEDVYFKIKEMSLQEKKHKCLLEIYEELKHDVNHYLPREEKIQRNASHTEEDEIWQVYRDVIYAATQRKFLLIRKNEVDHYKEGPVLCSAYIAERPDIPKARDLAKQSLNELGGISPADIMSHLLVISEAITNILKHASQGNMKIVATDSKIHVVVEDNGPGFSLKLLPNTTLMAGYSTKKSLGQGFTLMMKMTECVLLSTVPGEGSTLILVFNRKAGG